MNAAALLVAVAAGTCLAPLADKSGRLRAELSEGAGKKLMRRRRRRQLEDEVGPALRLLADSVDSGLTIPAAAARVGEGRGDASRRLGSFAQSCARGLTVTESLARLVNEPEGDVWAEAAFTIELHFRQGGDLAESLREVAKQLQLRNESLSGAQSATAQARFTANLVCALPLLAFVGAAVLFPARVSMVWSNPVSIALLSLGLAIQVASLVVIRQLSGV